MSCTFVCEVLRYGRAHVGASVGDRMREWALWQPQQHAYGIWHILLTCDYQGELLVQEARRAEAYEMAMG